MLTNATTKPVLPLGRLAQELIAFGELEHSNGGLELERFVTCLQSCQNPKANSGIFALFSEFVRTLAAKDSVEYEDGEAVETCRKICDMLGWVPKNQ